MTWEEVKKELRFTEEDEKRIAEEMELIRTMVRLREEKGLTQTQLADKCDMKQSVLARMEKSAHSPKISSLLKVLTTLGYKLKIVPMEQGNK